MPYFHYQEADVEELLKVLRDSTVSSDIDNQCQFRINHVFA